MKKKNCTCIDDNIEVKSVNAKAYTNKSYLSVIHSVDFKSNEVSRISWYYY